MTSFDGDGRPRIDPHLPEADPRLAAPADPWLTESPTSVVADATALRDASAAPDATAPPPTTAMPDATAVAHAAPWQDATSRDAAAAAYGGPLPPTQPFGVEAPGPEIAYGVGKSRGGPTPGRTPHAIPVTGWNRPRPGPGRARRSLRWALAILVAWALLIGGPIAFDWFDSADTPKAGPVPQVTRSPAGQATRTPAAQTTPTRSPGAASEQPPAGGGPANAAAPSASAAAAGPQVVYEVTASGSGNIGSVEYTDADGDSIRLSGIRFPWRLTFTQGPQRRPLALHAQRKSGGDKGPVTCTVTVDGKLTDSVTSHGRFASVLC